MSLGCDMEKEILYENRWMNMVKLEGWYVCTDEVRTMNNDFVFVLPYLKKVQDPAPHEYLLRVEYNPAHSEYKETSCITGQCESGVVRYHAQMELKEEGGYTVPMKRLQYLGHCNPFKSSMAKIHMFAIEIKKTDKQHEASGDGTAGEEGAYPIWVPRDGNEILMCKDPYVHTAIMRLDRYLRDETFRNNLSTIEP